VLHRGGVDNIDIGTVERCYRVSTLCEHTNEFAAELTGFPKHGDFDWHPSQG
jgi:hypothetical protein